MAARDDNRPSSDINALLRPSRRPQRLSRQDPTPLHYQQHQYQHQYQQQQQQQQQQQPQEQLQYQLPPSQTHSLSFQQPFSFGADFDLDEPFRGGLSLSHDHNRGHSGHTNVKQIALSSPTLPGLTAKPEKVTTTTASLASDASSANTTASNSNASSRKSSVSVSARDDRLISTDFDAIQPYHVDFGAGSASGNSGGGGGASASERSRRSSTVTTTTTAMTTPITTIARESRKPAATPAPKMTSVSSTLPDSSLNLLDDFFKPTLEPFDGPPPPAPRPIAKTLSSRPRQHVQLPMPQQPPQQPPQYQPQHQQQQQHPSQHPQQTKRAQEHYDSSLDFFSSLEGTLSGLSHQSSMSSPVSSSLAPSAQSKQPTQLPAFPSSDYSVFARTSTINKATPVSHSAQQPSGKNVSSAVDDSSTAPVSLFTTTAPMTPFDFSASRASATAAAASVTPATLSEPTPSVTFQRKNRDSHPFQPSSSSISVPAPTSAGDLKPTLSTSSFMPSEWALATPAARVSLTSSSVLTPLPSKAPPKIPARIMNTPQNPIPLPSQSSGSRSYLTPQASKQSQQPSSRRSASSHIPQDSLAQDLRLQEAALDPMPQPAQRKSHALPPPLPPSQVSTSSLPVAEVTPSPWEDDEDFYRPAPPPPPLPQMTAAPSRKPSPIPPTTHAQPQPQPQSQSQPQPQSQSQSQPQPQSQAQPQQKQRKKQHQQQQQQPSDKALKQAPPSPLSPKELRQGIASGNSPSSTSVASTSDSITPYPPPPPLILYSDDQITISSLHLTIHAFYFPLNTPLTISLLSITDVETLPAHGDAENSGGMAGWLKYKNWGMSALSDIWWARDPQRSVTGVFMTSTLPSKASGAGDKENAPPVHVVVRVKGEWLRKGFGVQDERGVKVLQDAWRSVKENEVGLKPLKSARGESGHDHEGNLAANKLMGDGANGGGGGSEKRRWLNYQNTWTAYPFADDSPQFLAQQQRRGGSAVSVVGGLGSTLASKAMRYHQPLRPRKSASSSSGGVAVLGEDESCGDDPLFIDNDLNIHEEI